MWHNVAYGSGLRDRCSADGVRWLAVADRSVRIDAISADGRTASGRTPIADGFLRPSGRWD
jgi:hypothetical protein